MSDDTDDFCALAVRDDQGLDEACQFLRQEPGFGCAAEHTAVQPEYSAQ